MFCGARRTVSSVGSRSNVSAPAFAASPDMATAGNAAADTTMPASRPQMPNDAAPEKTVWSRFLIQLTSPGYGEKG
ncbi:hypothetical protein JCM9534A_46860 [Catenuloplanes indicus JCM 9534]